MLSPGASRPLVAITAVSCFLVSWAAAADDVKTIPLSLTQTIALPQIKAGMNHLAADAKRGRFFVTVPRDRVSVVVDLKAGRPLQTLAGPSVAACFLPDLDRLCVSGHGVVAFYDGDSLTPAGKVDVDGDLDELQYDAGKKRLCVGMMDTDKAGIAVIDVPGRKLVAKLKLPAKPQGFVVGSKADRIYVNTPGAEQVTVLDGRTGTIVGEWKLTGAQANYPVALDEKNHRLFVGCRKPARMLVLDTGTGKTVAGIDTGGDADDMSFDPGSRHVYLACGSGVITTIEQVDADHYRKLSDTSTAEDARNSLFVPALKTFYLAVPRQGDRPTELRAYRAKD
jgi:hypothetical protein